MNLTHNTDHLEVLNHISHISNLQKIAEGAAQGSVPSTASTTNYGPKGQEVASKSNTSYANVKTSSNGNIIGGELRHSSKDSNGKPIDGSSMTFSPDGKPTLVTTRINNRFSEGVFKKIQTDMSELNWFAQSNILSGDIKLSTTEKGNLRSEGSLTYDNELISKASFKHYSAEGDGAISGYTNIDYGKTKFVGSRIIGGYISLACNDVNQKPKSTSSMFMSDLGRVLQVHTQNLDSNGDSKSAVIADFSALAFTPRNEFKSGLAKYRVTDKDGDLQSETQVKFDGEVPNMASTQAYDKNQSPSNRIEIDYSNAQFNNDLKVVSSSVTAKVYNVDNKLISSTNIEYNGDGSPINKNTDLFDPETGEHLTAIQKDQNNVRFDHQNKPMSGEVQQTSTDVKTGKTVETTKSVLPTKVETAIQDEAPTATRSASNSEDGHCTVSKLKDAQGNVTEVKESCTRSNGTLYKSVVTNVENDKPTTSTMLLYGTDGKTVTKNYKFDLSGIEANAGEKISGSVKMQAYFGKDTLQSESQLNY